MSTRTIEAGLAATLKAIASEMDRNSVQDGIEAPASAVMRRRLGEMLVSAYSGRTTMTGA